MQNKELDITAIGARLKKEAKAHNLKNDDMAALIGYSCGKQVSPIYSGKKALTDGQIRAICSKWGYREQYILCLDDYKTEKDILESNIYAEFGDFDNITKFLKTCGIKVEIIMQKEAYDIFCKETPSGFVCNFLRYFVPNISNFSDEDIKKYIDDNLVGEEAPDFVTYRITYKKKVSYLSAEEFDRFCNSIKENTAFIFNTFF